MSKFTETEYGKDLIENLTQAIIEHYIYNTDDEKLIKEQKTKIYKWYCKIMYGHLYKNDKCIRCGQIKNQ